jgi:hypothetical protein
MFISLQMLINTDIFIMEDVSATVVYEVFSQNTKLYNSFITW